MDESNESERLREDAMRLLLRHTGVPSDFEATVVVKADAEAVKNARETLRISAGDKVFLAVMTPLLLPFLLLGMGCAMRNHYKLLKGLTEGAENDVYVFGKGGFATINNGTVKAWTASSDMILVPDMTMFQKQTSDLCGTSAHRQTVLVVRKNPILGDVHSATCCESEEVASFQSGRYQQVWFVSAKHLQTLPGTVQMAVLESVGGGGMAGLMGMAAEMTRPAMQPTGPAVQTRTSSYQSH